MRAEAPVRMVVSPKSPGVLRGEEGMAGGEPGRGREGPGVRESGWKRPEASLPQAYSILGSVRLLSRVLLLATPWTAARQASLSITSSWSLCRLMSIESVMPSNHLSTLVSLLISSTRAPYSRFWAGGSRSMSPSLCRLVRDSEQLPRMWERGLARSPQPCPWSIQ